MKSKKQKKKRTYFDKTILAKACQLYLAVVFSFLVFNFNYYTFVLFVRKKMFVDWIIKIAANNQNVFLNLKSFIIHNFMSLT